MARSLELDQKSRNELVAGARELGVERPERMTRVELVDEIIRRTTPASEQAEARGLFGVARSMLASVIESGLNLPEAASVIRGQVTARVPAGNQAPVATVTLAEIYAAQGHRGRALSMIEEVLRAEPDHQEALRVQRALLSASEASRGATSEGQGQHTALSTSPAFGGDSSSQYVPAGFVETSGEEVETGKPPQIEPAPIGDELAMEEVTQVDAFPEPQKSDVNVYADEESVGSGRILRTSDHPTELAPLSDDELSASTDVFPSNPEKDEASGVMERPIDSGWVVGEASTEAAPILIMRKDDAAVRLYWELPSSVLAQCGVDPSEGHASIRLLVVTPSGARPSHRHSTHRLDQGATLSPSSGWLEIECEVDAAVRAALGWALGDDFLPLCVGKTPEKLQQEGCDPALLRRAGPYVGL